MREYYLGAYFPLIGRLRQEGSVSLETLKKMYMDGVDDEHKEIRKQKFERWLEQLQEDHVVSVEYETVTFNEEQWKRITE